MDSEKKKILIVIVILLLLVFGIIAVRRGRPIPTEENSSQEAAPEESAPTASENNIIRISSEKTDYQVDEVVPVNISFKALGKKLFGSDIVLLFDPEFLSTQVEDIQDGDFFASYPRKTVDPENGIVKLSAYQGQDIELADQYYSIVNINFKALKKGETEIALSWIKGATNTTNLVENGTSQNILEAVGNLKVTVE